MRLRPLVRPPSFRTARAFGPATVLALASLLAAMPLAAPREAVSSSESHGPPLARQTRLGRLVELTLTAAPSRLSLVPGTTTNAYAYNGSVPGPTIELREGDSVVITLRNQLAEPTTIHWHGLHIPVTSDGSPFDPVPAGGTFVYRFRLLPGSAGTYWYHPHPHHVTGQQIARGLYGALIVRAADDPLPETLRERILVLSDNQFRPDGDVDIAPAGSLRAIADEMNGREGDVLFVNGKVLPTLSIRSGEVQRWRVINASAARVYRLSLGGETFLHVGSDGGLFERPVPVREITVANAERVELLVRGTGAPGSRAVLQTLPYDRYVPQTRPADWSEPRDLLVLQYTTEPVASPPRIPEVLRPIPVIDTSKATARRLVVMSQGLINGKPMDMNRVDLTVPFGATEIWELENVVGMDHPFHLHGFQFQVLDRNGVPEPFRSWKDVVNVPRHQTARFIVRYDDYPGKWMFHCHILDHEDRGMMGILEVKPKEAAHVQR